MFSYDKFCALHRIPVTIRPFDEQVEVAGHEAVSVVRDMIKKELMKRDMSSRKT
jgi:hypothetical protein